MLPPRAVECKTVFCVLTGRRGSSPPRANLTVASRIWKKRSHPRQDRKKLYPGSSMFTAGSASTGMYRGLKFWESAVNETGSLNQDAVIRALDHAKIAAGPGGPAEMAPGQHHARLNMYIAQASNGIFEVVKNLGVIEPDESVVSAKLAASR
jgi:ABC-type branched-subunit amino acid transport system substrate-binding protein